MQELSGVTSESVGIVEQYYRPGFYLADFIRPENVQPWMQRIFIRGDVGVPWTVTVFHDDMEDPFYTTTIPYESLPLFFLPVDNRESFSNPKYLGDIRPFEAVGVLDENPEEIEAMWQRVWQWPPLSKVGVQVLSLRLAAGDESAEARIVQSFGIFIWNKSFEFFLKYKELIDFSEVFNESYLAVFAAIDKYDINKGALSTFFGMLIRNVQVDLLKKVFRDKKLFISLEGLFRGYEENSRGFGPDIMLTTVGIPFPRQGRKQDLSRPTEELVVQLFEDKVLIQAINSLPHEERAFFLGRFVYGLSTRLMADTTGGISHGTVHNRITAARKALKENPGVRDLIS